MLEKFYIATEKFWMISDVFYDGKETLEANLKFLQKNFRYKIVFVCCCWWYNKMEKLMKIFTLMRV